MIFRTLLLVMLAPEMVALRAKYIGDSPAAQYTRADIAAGRSGVQGRDRGDRGSSLSAPCSTRMSGYHAAVPGLMFDRPQRARA